MIRIKPFVRTVAEPDWHDGTFHVLLWVVAAAVIGGATLFGCASGVPIVMESADADLKGTPVEPLPVLLPRIEFAAPADLYLSVEKATKRWAAATCRDIGMGYAGASYKSVPYESVPFAWGHTEGPEIRIYEDLRGDDRDITVAHEMGHGLGGPGHSEFGLQALGSRDDVIDASSLDHVCAVFDCLCFTPEVL